MPLSILPDEPAHFHAILAALPGNFILLLPDAPTYTIVAMSAELLQQTGREAAQVVGQSVFVAYPENPKEVANNGPAQMRSALDASLRDHQPHELPLVRYDVPTADGRFEERYWSGRSQVVLDAQSAVCYLLFTSVDLTAQRRADHEQRARQQAEARNRELEARVQERTRQVHEQGQRLERLFQQAPAAICILSGPELVYELINPIYQQFFPERQLLGKPLREALPELADHAAYHTMRHVFDTGETVWQQALHAPLARTQDGVLEDRYFNYIQQPRYDAQGRIDGVLVFGFEVTELVQARQQADALQAQVLAAAQHQAEQRETFYQIFEETPAAICIQRGPDHRYEYVNAAYQAFFPGRDFLGRSVAAVLPETVDSGVVGLLDRVYHTGETYFGEELPLLIAQPEGPPKQMYFTFTYQALRENGQIVGISTFAYNVAEQVLARQQRETERQQLQQVFEQAPVAIFVLRGAEYVFEVVNPSMGQMLGAAPEQMLGKGYFELLPKLAEQGYRHLLDQVWFTGQPYVAQEQAAQLPHHGKGETGYYDFTYVPLRDAAGNVTGIMCVAVEVTHQVLARQQVQDLNEGLAAINEELAATNEELQATNMQLVRTNADLDNFIYTASHDLKAPISNIEGLLLALGHELPPAGRVGEVPTMLQLMLDAVERFKRTIQHLTDVSRLQKEHAQPTTSVALAPVIEEVRLDLAPLLQQMQAQLQVRVPEYVMITFSEKNLRSVVYNLLSNALKYRHPDRVPHIDITYERQETTQVLTVQDNGLGMDLAQGTERLFAMFQRLHAHVEGSGVGLYMVKRMVENAGGRIEVESQLGQGSTFRVYFSVA